MEYLKISGELSRRSTSYRYTELKSYMELRANALKAFTDRLDADEALADSLVMACNNSQDASSITLHLARCFGEWKEVVDPCSDRVFITTTWLGTTYMLEEIE